MQDDTEWCILHTTYIQLSLADVISLENIGLRVFWLNNIYIHHQTFTGFNSIFRRSGAFYNRNCTSAMRTTKTTQLENERDEGVNR